MYRFCLPFLAAFSISCYSPSAKSVQKVEAPKPVFNIKALRTSIFEATKANRYIPQREKNIIGVVFARTDNQTLRKLYKEVCQDIKRNKPVEAIRKETQQTIQELVEQQGYWMTPYIEQLTKDIAHVFVSGTQQYGCF